MNWVAAAVCAVIGLVAAQGYHVLLYRSPMRMRRHRPLPHCGRCGVATAPGQRIATVAVLKRDADCHECGNRLWPSSPWFELVMAVLLGALGLRFGFSWPLPAFALFFASLWALAVIDLRDYVLPNRIIYPTLFGCLGLLVVAAVMTGEYGDLVSALLSMAIIWLIFFVMWFAYPRGMGFGDVRLSALIGLLTGWLGVPFAVLAVMLGLIFGGVVSAVLFLTRLRRWREALPFGPTLVLGAIVAVLAGRPILLWYLGF